MNNVWESKDKIVKKEIIQKGIYGQKPTEKSICEVLFEDTNTTISPVNFSKENLHSEYLNDHPQKMIAIGDASSQIDREIERALQMMDTKEQSLITISLRPTPETRNTVIQITTKATLLNQKIYQYIWNWSEDEVYETALKQKEIGTNLFRAGRYTDAFFKFSKACKLLITLEPLNHKEDLDGKLAKKLNDLRVVAYNNMAECHLQQKNYDHVITLCAKVLARDENNIKALYRRGVAHSCLRDWEKAFEDMKQVTELDPGNNVAREKLHLYDTEVRKANQKLDNIMKKMFLGIQSD